MCRFGTVGDQESIHLTLKGLPLPSKRTFEKHKPEMYFEVPKGLYKGLLPTAILLTPSINDSKSRYFITNISANSNPD